MRLISLLTAAAIGLAFIAGCSSSDSSSHATGSTHARASALTPEQLSDRAIHRRAVEAVIWGMPIVNYDLMVQEMLTKTSGKVNEVIYWGKPLDWHNQTLTPNPDTLYVMTFLNTKDVGPI